jgi:hypothetical protein
MSKNCEKRSEKGAGQFDGQAAYKAFLAHCQADDRKRKLLTGLAKRGCGAGRIFACTRRYWTKPSDLDELTKTHETTMRRILREAMRRDGPPEYRAAILAMQNRAHSQRLIARCRHKSPSTRLFPPRCDATLCRCGFFLTVRTVSSAKHGIMQSLCNRHFRLLGWCDLRVINGLKNHLSFTWPAPSAASQYPLRRAACLTRRETRTLF